MNGLLILYAFATIIFKSSSQGMLYFKPKNEKLIYIHNPVEAEMPGHWVPLSVVRAQIYWPPPVPTTKRHRTLLTKITSPTTKALPKPITTPKMTTIAKLTTKIITTKATKATPVTASQELETDSPTTEPAPTTTLEPAPTTTNKPAPTITTEPAPTTKEPASSTTEPAPTTTETTPTDDDDELKTREYSSTSSE